MAPRLAPLPAAVAAALGGLAYRALRPRPVASTLILDPAGGTTVDPETSAVRSVQAAVLTLPPGQLDRIWSPMHLERLARTYWAFLTRVTLGLVRVEYSETGRCVVLVASPLVLLRFHAPEYAMDGGRGVVRWRIRDGVLVSRRGRGSGHLQIDVRRAAPAGDGVPAELAHVEVEVANFYPAIATRLSQRLYAHTQSRIHVLITHGFLRSLARLRLARSRVGRFAPPEAP